MNVARLVKRAKKNNKEALMQLIMAERDAYYRLALTYMGNDHDAMDAMEDMIVAVYEKIDQLKKEEAFYSWSKTILANCCKGLLHKRNKVVLIDDWDRGHAHRNENEPIYTKDAPDTSKADPSPLSSLALLGARASIGGLAPADDPYRHSDQQMDINTMLLNLNEQQKEAIQLKYLHDLDYQMIADITHVSIGTVKSRIFQGLKKLREHFGGDVNE
ncbi:sigma-70 family RNA polymerase sigma factor [Paenibacillus sp. D2_2]|uniref:sigma-70 family RNA polymerase sigma factor n=1 Tax=Paenibacillus sp. D2_2 TaxID=3073092 RepID=UPI0028150556|nr:sigma-70 family RNA polymerase sigma factor [Paenibacillus sp. D2_2]WMT40406.1 sigma-70 family RNA polymerase sigma factor [Paenibacillus sp. D2_2]